VLFGPPAGALQPRPRMPRHATATALGRVINNLPSGPAPVRLALASPVAPRRSRPPGCQGVAQSVLQFALRA
jgi:hypothetical protein